MRRFLGYLCYILNIACDVVAIYITSKAYEQTISYHLGLLLFMPLFIISYWFNTFFAQLFSGRDKKNKPYINKTFYRVLSNFSSLTTFAVLGFWTYIIISKNLYSTFF